jgi:hypothetical protein
LAASLPRLSNVAPMIGVHVDTKRKRKNDVREMPLLQRPVLVLRERKLSF